MCADGDSWDFHDWVNPNADQDLPNLAPALAWLMLKMPAAIRNNVVLTFLTIEWGSFLRNPDPHKRMPGCVIGCVWWCLALGILLVVW